MRRGAVQQSQVSQPAIYPLLVLFLQTHRPSTLHPAGRRKGVCPYYAARRALPEADVVLAPYASLLGAEAREALGLSVENNVVIVDEAHNLGRDPYPTVATWMGGVVSK